MKEKKKVVFISGPTTGDDYWVPFEKAEDRLQARGYVPLNPCRIPSDLDVERQCLIRKAMLSCADAVIFLSCEQQGPISIAEHRLAILKGIPCAFSVERLEGVLRC